MTDRKTHWEKVYLQKPPDELSWRQAEPRLSLELIRASGLPKDAAILDVGGGASTLVDYLLAEGYCNLSVLDVSAAALGHARQRLGKRAENVTWLEADITRFGPARPYALWHDRAAFHFLSEAEDRARYVGALERSLLPNAHVIIAAFAVGGPEKCSGLNVRQYDAERLRAELGAGFTLLEEQAEDHLTPTGKRQAFRYFRFQRTA